MSVMPLAYVAAPPRTPPAYGILSAAVVVEDSDSHGMFGFEYEPDSCGPVHTTVAVCVDTEQKQVDEGRGLVQSDPFVVYSLHRCKPVGFTDAQGYASRSLAAGEGRAVEQWLGAKLAAEADDNNGTWTAGSTAEALASLEHYIHCNFNGVGTIHMNRGDASGLLTERALDTSGTRLMTRLGNVVSAGCYDVSGGDAMYATGPVVLHRGAVFSPPDPILNTRTNEQYALAERAYSGAWECFAVKVTVTP